MRNEVIGVLPEMRVGLKKIKRLAVNVISKFSFRLS